VFRQRKGSQLPKTRLWSNHNYRLVFSASAVSNLGDGVTLVALPWLATLITRDPVMIGIVAMAGRLPWLLLSLPAGVWTDRADRRMLILRADGLRVFLTLCVVWLALSPAPGSPGLIWVLALLAFLLGAAEVVRDNAAQTLLPSLVTPDHLERANGQMWSVEHIMGQFIGPPLAGVLIGIGIAAPFGLDAATFALSVLLMAQIVLPQQTVLPALPFWNAIAEGAAWMRGNRVILRLALMLAVLSGANMACVAILVLYAQEVLALDATGYGFLLAAGAVGGVLGGLAGPGIAARLGQVATIRLSLVIMLAGFLIMGWTSHKMLAALALGADAFGGVLWNVVTVSFRQRTIPSDLLGRVNAIYRFFGTGATAIGAVMGGVIVAVLEPGLGRNAALHAPFLLAAGGCVLLALVAFRPTFRLG
jgi:MFS family permease